MEFNHFLSSYFPDPSYGGYGLFTDMLEQAQAADRLGYRGVTIPEHHLINILLTPSPLQMAVKVASITESIEVVTSVAVLPIRDMRVFAGEGAPAPDAPAGSSVARVFADVDTNDNAADFAVLTAPTPGTAPIEAALPEPSVALLLYLGLVGWCWFGER